MDYQITKWGISAYVKSLQEDDRAPGTIAKYRRDVHSLARFLGGENVTAEGLVAYKQRLLEKGYAPRSINAMLAACNGYFRFAGWQIKAKFLKVQRQLFRAPEREMSRAEYDRLLAAANSHGQARLALLMETMGATGIRVSEVENITVEAAKKGRATIHLKGKVRTILLPGKLCRKLLAYAKRLGLTSGAIFRTKHGRALSRRQIWYEMKRVARLAGVAPGKVFPHNLRRVFAVVFYRACKDIARLADVLGHSSMETTRIYLAVSGEEQKRQLDRLGLVS